MKAKPKSQNEEDDEEDEEDTIEGEIRLEEIDEDAANEAFELVDGQLRLANQKLEEAKLAKREHMFGLKDDRSLCVPSGVEHGAVVRQEATNKRALKEFTDKLVHKYGTLVRGFRRIFGATTDSVSYDEFKEAYERQSLKGDIDNAWTALVGEEAETCSLEEFDPGVVKDMEELRHRITERYGSSEAAFTVFDPQGTHQMNKPDFIRLCAECQFRGNERRVWDYLDTSGKGWKSGEGTISLEYIDADAVNRINETWDSRPHKRKPKPKEETHYVETDVVGYLKDYLLKRFGGSMVRARRTIDKHSCGIMTKKEFIHSLCVIGYKGCGTKLWAKLVDADAKGISLETLDPDALELLTAFYSGCFKRYHTLANAFKEEDNERIPSKTFTPQEFKKMCKAIKFNGSTDKLLLHLSHATSGNVTWQEVRFLEEMFIFKQEDPPEKDEDEEDEEDEDEEEERVGPCHLIPKRRPPPLPGANRPHGQFP